MAPPPTRHRRDRCPGVHRPWPAEDGLLVRLRLPGGSLPVAALERLLSLAERYGDGAVHLTERANLQLRALPGSADALTPEVLAALEATGVAPSRSHDLVRNILVSPQTGLAGGRADLRPLTAELDRLLRGRPALAGLPGRFLFVLDDGRGDLRERLEHGCDLGLAALDSSTAQLRVGGEWSETVPLAAAADRLVGLAERFLAVRGAGDEAPWHVRELAGPLLPARPPDPRLPAPAGPLTAGRVPGGHHLIFADGLLTRATAAPLLASPLDLVVTPWRGVLIPHPIQTEERR